MKSLFSKENFNFYSNILILVLLFLGGLVYADTNGIWNEAQDLRGGIIGSDEQDITSFYTFINPVNFNADVTIGNSSTNHKLTLNGEELQPKIKDYCVNGSSISRIHDNGSVECVSGASEIIPGFIAVTLPSGNSFFFLSSDFGPETYSTNSFYCDTRLNNGKLEFNARMASTFSPCGFKSCSSGWVDASSVPSVQCRVNFCDHGPSGPSKFGPTCTLGDNEIRVQGSRPYVGSYSATYSLG